MTTPKEPEGAEPVTRADLIEWIWSRKPAMGCSPAFRDQCISEVRRALESDSERLSSQVADLEAARTVCLDAIARDASELLKAEAQVAALEKERDAAREALDTVRGFAALHVHVPSQDGCANCRINAFFALSSPSSSAAKPEAR